jgi:type I restriction enzyme S subunit
MMAPALRFHGFDRAWTTLRLKDFAAIYDGTHQTPKYESSGIPFVSVENINDIKNSDKYISKEAFEKDFKVKPRKGDIFMTRITAGIIGAAAIVKDDMPVAYYVSLALIRLNKDVDAGFFFHLMATRQFRRELHKRIIHVAFPKKINLGDIGECAVAIPCLHEQKKVASFISELDAKLDALRRKRLALIRYKTGLIRRVFRQKLRFARFDGTAFPAWDERRFDEVFNRVTRKNGENNANVLTISAQQGLVNQREFFNKSVSASDVSGYYLIKKGEFAYNKSYSAGYPMGAIKRLNNYDKGVVSTLYICFSANSEIEAQFFEQFFEFGGLNSELIKLAQEGARNHGLLNVSVVELFKNVVVPYPSPEEQTKIVAFISAINGKIDAVSRQISGLDAFRRGVLQQMFV